MVQEGSRTRKRRSTICSCCLLQRWPWLVESDQKAAMWFRKAADQGIASAQYEMGQNYEAGRGVSQSPDKAVDWYRMAADQGHSEAQYKLGHCFYEGLGVQQSYDDAVIWFRKAADQGNAEAQFELGVCYSYGLGVQQSDEQASKWFRQARNQGYTVPELDFKLPGSQVHENSDDSSNVGQCRMAANLGNADAQLVLGEHYENGQGVPQSYDDATHWYNLAADQGVSEAKRGLKRCKRNCPNGSQHANTKDEADDDHIMGGDPSGSNSKEKKKWSMKSILRKN